MNRITCPSESLISLRTALRRSSNSPRNFAPAMSAPRSRLTTRLSLRPSGTSPAHDALREALGDGGLADARLADEHGVVLRPPAEDLDDPPDLVVPADDRVELAGPRLDGEVAAVLLQGLVGALGVRVGHPLATTDVLERTEERLAVRVMPAQQLLRLAAGLGRREQQMLGARVVVAQPAGLLLRPLDDALARAGRGSGCRPGSGHGGSGCRPAPSERRAGRRRSGAGSPRGCRRRARRAPRAGAPRRASGSGGSRRGAGRRRSPPAPSR